MTLLIGFLLTLPVSALAAVHKERGELVLPCVLMLNALLLYVTAVCGLLEYGVWAISGLNLLCIFPAVRNPSVLLKQFCTPATIAFILWSVLLYFANRGRMFYDWDEFSHWGLAAKALFVKGDLYCRFPELMNFPSYPPGMALLQYFYVKIPGCFAEDAVLFASSQFAAALMAAGLSTVRWCNWKIYLPYILLVWLIPLAFFEFFYSVYVDGILAMLLAFALYLLLSARKFNLQRIVMLSVTLCFMTLVKPSGSGLAIMVLAVTALANIRRPLNFLLPLTAVVAGNLSWKILVKINHCPVKFSGADITPVSICKAFFFNQPEHAHAVIGAWSIRLLPVLALLLTLAATAFFLSKQCRKNTAMQKALKSYSAIVPSFGIIFAVTMLIYYIFDFAVYEALQLASFERYMATVTLSGTMLLLFLGVNALVRLRRRRTYFKITVVILLLIPLFSWRTVGENWKHIATRSYCYLRGPQELMLQQLNTARQPEEKLALLAQGSPGTEAFILRYNAFGYAESVPWSVGKAKYKGDIWSEPIPPAEYSQMLAGTTWLYVHRADDEFRRDYAGLFANPAGIYDARLYKRRPDGRFALHEPETLTLDLDKFFFLAIEDEKGEIVNADILKTAQFRQITIFYSSAAPVTVTIGSNSALLPAEENQKITMPWSYSSISFDGRKKAQLKLHKLSLK